MHALHWYLEWHTTPPAPYPDTGSTHSIHYALFNGYLDVAKLFLLKCVIDVNIRRVEETPLYLASMNGKFDVVRFLEKPRKVIVVARHHVRSRGT